MGEINELILLIREARDDLWTQKTADRRAKKGLDEAMERIGAQIVASSMNRRTIDDGSDVQ